MKQTLVIIFIVLFSSTLVAQDFQGVATYKSQRKLDIQLDSTQVNSEMHQRMMEMMKMGTLMKLSTVMEVLVMK